MKKLAVFLLTGLTCASMLFGCGSKNDTVETVPVAEVQESTAEHKSASAGRRECEETKLVSDPWYAAFGAADCDFLFWK